MNVKIYIGNENCTKCGKKHKKVFEIDGKPYGSSCANEILKKDLTAPLWLYELAEKWVKEDEGYDKNNVSDCATNFFAHYGSNEGGTIVDRYGASKLWLKPFKMLNKNVKVDWQFEIHDYIVSRYSELNNL